MSSTESKPDSPVQEKKPKSPSKRPPKTQTDSSGRATSDPEMVRELMRRLADGCPPSLRTELAEKYGVSPKKLHTLWSTSLKARMISAVNEKFPLPQ